MVASAQRQAAPVRQDESDHAVDASSGIVSVGWIDASRLTRECITMALAKTRPLFVIISFDSTADCLRHVGADIDLIVYHSHESDYVITEELALLRERFVGARLVVLSDAVTIELAVVRQVMAHGASGLISTRTAGLQMLVSAIALIGSGGTFLPREALMEEPSGVARPQVRQGYAEPHRLTQRETEVLALVRQGKANKTIAYELGMSGSTVKVHVRHIMRKMGATNRTQAAFNVERLTVVETGPKIPER
ncbi:LuxR family transcriptional regulator [Acidisoma cladoniae]|jgi:DNA-binding NarL/FixJ family response regulator|uniref:LuxR family transcriptional regulator n=1 Tax=Acidisoma cladoniae TaxID=3040935 RepID=UPI00254B5472|nr:response regulator transcription factor [Acidisoma sp. PAMC 29798]